jgi:hypothetical protein
MRNSFLILFAIFAVSITSLAGGSGSSERGVDFRMQLASGKLDFTSVSGVKRKFIGVGSELQTSLYLLELTRFRANIFIASRVMTWTGQNVLDAEYDDLQTFSVAPGLELHYGPLFIKSAAQRINVNAYNISSTSIGKQFIIEGPCYSGGINYRFGSLGLGLQYSKMNVSVPGERLGLAQPSQYLEDSYSFNFIYYIGESPGKFFGDLFN